MMTHLSQPQVMVSQFLDSNNMKTLIPFLFIVNVLSFIAGHFWVNDYNSSYNVLMVLPIILGIISVASIIVIHVNEN